MLSPDFPKTFPGWTFPVDFPLDQLKTWKLLLDAHDIEGSTINESAEVTTKLHIKEPNNDNSKADHSTAQEVL